jgi:hypothetical protein
MPSARQTGHSTGGRARLHHAALGIVEHRRDAVDAEGREARAASAGSSNSTGSPASEQTWSDFST